MTLKLYNTRTRQKEKFEPLDPEAVRMYVCGPTVYDFAHIGNARPVIVFDVLFRLLRRLYGADRVIYARNITDVDDKINARAAEEGVPIRELTGRTAAQFHADVAALGALPPTIEPRATDHIDEMISLIEQLIARGHAYVAEGHVLFDVASDPDYGSLARRTLDEMRAGARVEVAPYKRDPMDFVLWKPSTGSEPGWESAWGFGRPGWHLECSAMAEKHLGEVFDIHGGGIDLLFPHHENEVAQSTCAHGTKIMANIWMHNGHLQVEGQKMSKSLGNFVTIRDLLDGWGGVRWSGAAIRLAMLESNYREPINWTAERLALARRKLADWIRELREEGYPIKPDKQDPHSETLSPLLDDLNTHEMIVTLDAIYQDALKGRKGSKQELGAALTWLGLYDHRFPYAYEDSGWGYNIRHDLYEKHKSAAHSANAAILNSRDTALEVIEQHVNDASPGMRADGVWLKVNSSGEITFEAISPDSKRDDTKIGQLVEARKEARRKKNWAEADRIRDKLAAMGVTLKDAKNPSTGEIETTWEIAR